MDYKTKLFHIFWENMSATFKKLGIAILKEDEEPSGKLYLCPLSLLLFPVESIKAGYLSIEHVPPESLGGKPLVLTDTATNNKDGHTSDKKLLKYFEGQNFNANRGEVDVKISSQMLDFKGISAKFSLSPDKKVKLSIVSSKKNIQALDYKGLFRNWDGANFNLSWSLPQRPDEKAMLKCAYLTAFHALGYELIFGRKGFKKGTYGQLLKYMADTNSAIDFPVIYRPFHAPLEKYQAGIINSPAEFRSLFVNLTFTLKGNDFKYVVFLPHPKADRLDNLYHIRNTVKNEEYKSLDFKISELKPIIVV